MELLTAADVARKLNIAPSTVYRLKSKGALGHTKIGGSVRFTQRHVDEYIRNNSEAPNRNTDELSREIEDVSNRIRRAYAAGNDAEAYELQVERTSLEKELIAMRGGK
jgi:excisionase family DNA binding protein